MGSLPSPVAHKEHEVFYLLFNGRMLRPSAKTCKCSVVDDGGYVVLIINPRTETIRFCPFCGRRLW